MHHSYVNTHLYTFPHHTVLGHMPACSFYQAQPGTCQWAWGMQWDHVASRDLALWTRLQSAVQPGAGDPHAADADGCFSGSISVSRRWVLDLYSCCWPDRAALPTCAQATSLQQEDWAHELMSLKYFTRVCVRESLCALQCLLSTTHCLHALVSTFTPQILSLERA